MGNHLNVKLPIDLFQRSMNRLVQCVCAQGSFHFYESGLDFCCLEKKTVTKISISMKATKKKNASQKKKQKKKNKNRENHRN